MLKLSAPDDEFCAAYAKARRIKFNKEKAKMPVSANAATGLSWADDFLDYLESHLDRLLIGKPDVLRAEIVAINSHPLYHLFGAYCAARPKAKSGLRQNSMEVLLELLGNLFSYDSLSASKNHGAYDLISHYQQRICPYCQMHHVNFYIADNSADLTMRPALDHFYPESKYPYLSVSLFNLIPACEQCNSRIKLAKDPLAEDLANPFEDTRPVNFASGWNAITTLDRIGAATDFNFSFTGTNPDSIAFSKFFHLGARYGWYRHEVFDMAKRYQRFMDFDAHLRTAIDPLSYLLNFETGDADERMIGFMLADVAKCMVSAYGAHKPAVDVSA